MRVRPPAVAGRFYQGEPRLLAREVDRMLDQAGPREPTPMTGVIVPHAGHIYSGPIAASAYRLIPDVERVVLIGPSHFAPVAGLAVSGADAWETPLGLVRLDRDPDLPVNDEAHGYEHCLEVQVPFLQRVLGDGWTLLPVVVGHATPEQVSQFLERVLDPATLLVVSTDLSHYLPYEVAARRDAATAQRIVARNWRAIGDQDACGAYPLRGALAFADKVELLDLRSSGDTAGDPDRVVGYGAFVIGRRDVVAVARESIAAALGHRPAPRLPAGLQSPGASFVTLRSTSSGELRGCIGSLEPHRPLGQDVAEHALDAAFRDPRFPPLQSLDDVSVEVSVLGPITDFPCSGYDDLVARVPVGSGVLVESPRHRATFLPQVWQQLPSRAAFVAALWKKAGLRSGEWPAGTKVGLYHVEEFAEPE